MESGGAFKSGCPKKRPFALQRTCIHSHAQPRYEASLRAISNGLHRASANVKFDVHDYCSPPGRFAYAAPRSTGGWRDRTMFDVNFIILAKKLRPGSSPSDPFSLSRFSRRPPPRYPLYFCFSFRIFLCRNNFFFHLRASLISRCVSAIFYAFCARLPFSLSLFDLTEFISVMRNRKIVPEMLFRYCIIN